MKRKLIDIIKDYNVTWEQGLEAVSAHLEEEMVSGRGKLLWISEEGQVILDDIFPMSRLLRGRVHSAAPNLDFVMVNVQGVGRVGCRIPSRLRGRLIGKIIHMLEIPKDGELHYEWQKSPEA